ncbi:MAG: CHAT domain-containing protein [Blastocatellia bacterium]
MQALFDSLLPAIGNRKRLLLAPDGDLTRELMEDFYRRILRGEGRAEALRRAQMEKKKKYPDPSSKNLASG